MKNIPQINDILPLSASQRLFLQGASGSTRDNVHVYGYRLAGDVDETIVERVWGKIVRAYPSLRTSLHILAPDRAFQVEHEAAEPTFIYQDLRHLPADKREAEVARYQQSESETLFHWHQPPLLRIGLHRLDDRDCVMTVTIDHMIFDGWSLGLAIRDFFQGCAALKRKTAWSLPAGPSVRAYLQWHQRQDLAGALQWFRNKMAMIADQRLPFVERGQWPDAVCADAAIFLPFSEAEDRELAEGAKRLGVTPYVLFQGAWSLILSRCQKERTAYFLSSAASRPAEVPEIDNLFGLLLGVIPHAYACPDDAVAGEWLDALRAYQVEAMNYHYVPPCEVAALQKELAPTVQTSCVVFQNMDTGTDADAAETQDITVSQGGVISRSNYPLVVGAQPFPRLQLSFMYDRRLFREESMHKLGILMRGLMLGLQRDRSASLQTVCSREPAASLLCELAASSPEHFNI